MSDAIHLPTLKQLRHLVALADHRHFGHAAEACSITQSSLSASLRELETLLGRQIVERTKRSVIITPLGNDIVSRARELLIGAQDIVDAVAAAAAPLNGPLRLGVLPTIGPYLLPRVLPLLRRDYPDLRLFLREDPTARLIDLLRRGELDAMVMAFPYDVGDLQTRRVAEDSFWLAMPPGTDLDGQDSATIASIDIERLMLLQDGHCLRDHALAALRLMRAPQNDAFQGSSLATLVQMVENGLGLTLLPKMAIDAGILRGSRLQARPIAERAALREIGLAWRKTSARRAEFQILGDILAAELATPVTPRRR